MDIGLKIRRNPNFHYIRYDPLRPTEELTQLYGSQKSAANQKNREKTNFQTQF